MENALRINFEVTLERSDHANTPLSASPTQCDLDIHSAKPLADEQRDCQGDRLQPVTGVAHRLLAGIPVAVRHLYV